LAHQCPDIEVTVVDRNVERIEAWKSDQPHVSEPGLLEIVKVSRDGIRSTMHRNLHFTTQFEESVQKADIIMVCVDTPTKAQGSGAGYSLDIDSLEQVVLSIAKCAKSDTIVVEKSTVPVGTGQTIGRILNTSTRIGVKFEILSNPEFLAEGTAIQNLLHPDRVLIGSSDSLSGLLAAETLANIYAAWVPRSRIITMNLFSSELSKIAANAMLAQRVSSINALSAICEATGANIQQVAHAIGTDSRIGPHMLNASFGFGGSCFRKDISSLIYLCRCLHLDTVASYWESILDMNEYQKSRAVTRIVSLFHNNVRRKKIAILGFAFKEGTCDTRDSSAIHLVRGLLREGASVSIYDPCVKKSQIYEDLDIDGTTFGGLDSLVTVCQSGEETCEGAHAVLIATNWDEFRVKQNPYVDDAVSLTLANGEPISISNGKHGCCEDGYDTSMSGRANPMLPVVSHDGNNLGCQYGIDSGVQNGKQRNGSGIANATLHSSVWNKNSFNDVASPRPLDWNRVARVMNYPRVVFGNSTCLDVDTLIDMGFLVEIIGSETRSLQR
jgi:UDPglucose 6-dehydrogenase